MDVKLLRDAEHLKGCPSSTQAQEHWSKLYRGIPRNVMEWPQRFLRLMLDLTKHKPDIVCLQVRRYI